MKHKSEEIIEGILFQIGKYTNWIKSDVNTYANLLRDIEEDLRKVKEIERSKSQDDKKAASKYDKMTKEELVLNEIKEFKKSYNRKLRDSENM